MHSAFRTLAIAMIATVTLSSAAAAFSGPFPIASGLRGAHSLAVDRRGDLYVGEQLSPQVAVLTLIRSGQGGAEGDDDRDEPEAEEGDTASATSTIELYRVAAQAPFTDPRISSTSFDAAGNVYFVVSQHLATDIPFVRHTVRDTIVRLDRRTHRAHELFAAEGSHVSFGEAAFQGLAVDRDGTLYFSRGNALLRLAPGAASVAIATFSSTSRITSWPVIEPDGSVVVIVTDGALTGIHVLRRNGDLVRLAHVQPTAPGARGFIYLGTDASGNLFTVTRDRRGFVNFSCATSTTMRLFRIDGTAVMRATEEVIPTEVGSVTQDGSLGLIGTSTDTFRVSRRGEVFFGVYPFVPFCPPTPVPPFPFNNQAAAQRLLAFTRQPDGSLSPQVLIDAPGAPPGAAGLRLALRTNGQLFVASSTEGSLVRFDR